ncbi:chromosome partitioning protein [Solihabitans fulvus]|uniref:Chromosome partitioning protein n=1 Tax=Solihabitans fulvus TaxID=1892852 RepID=A0A5B2WMQ2_9PSEU|nr:chromosome partitioning protein [Solihabitans fulvus]KAA2253313.1 chromosome partitioning protein [Solihabitans fulvus]
MLVAVVSVKGSPGVTTFATALAARWPAPGRPVLVEADTSGGDLAARFSLESTPGLLSLAAAARRSADPALVWQHAQALPGGLPVVTAPPDADRARGALSALTPDPAAGAGVLRTAGNVPDAVLIVDCGRIDTGSPALPIVRAADAMVLLTGAHADDLAHLPRRLPAIGRWSPHPVMLLVGDGYSLAEVARELGVPPLGRVPNDPRGAAVLCGRPHSLRRGRGGPAHSPLGQLAHKVATVLAAQQAPPRALPHQAPVPHRPVPVLRAVPGVPGGPVSVNGVRSAPLPPGHPTFPDTSPQPGAAS